MNNKLVQIAEEGEDGTDGKQRTCEKNRIRKVH